MVAIEKSLVAREMVAELVKREKNWAAREPGVMVVFCIVGVVGIALIGLFISKKLSARRDAKQTL